MPNKDISCTNIKSKQTTITIGLIVLLLAWKSKKYMNNSSGMKLLPGYIISNANDVYEIQKLSYI